jgi:cytochrome P450
MLAFGHGPHYCLGANLALQEMSCMIEAALEFMPEGTTLLEDEIEWEAIGIMTRAVNLPIELP